MGRRALLFKDGVYARRVALFVLYYCLLFPLVPLASFPPSRLNYHSESSQPLSQFLLALLRTLSALISRGLIISRFTAVPTANFVLSMICTVFSLSYLAQSRDTATWKITRKLFPVEKSLFQTGIARFPWFYFFMRTWKLPSVFFFLTKRCISFLSIDRCSSIIIFNRKILSECKSVKPITTSLRDIWTLIL